MSFVPVFRNFPVAVSSYRLLQSLKNKTMPFRHTVMVDIPNNRLIIASYSVSHL